MLGKFAVAGEKGRRSGDSGGTSRFFIGVELDPEHFTVAEARIAGATGSPEAAKAANETAPAGAQLVLL